MAAQAAAAEADLAALSRSFETAKEAARQDAEVARAEAAREIARQRTLIEELKLEAERSKSGLVMKLGKAVDESETQRVRAEARCEELEAALKELQGRVEQLKVVQAKEEAESAKAESARVAELLQKPQREAAEQKARERTERLRAAFGLVRVVSGSADGTLRVWGVADGARCLSMTPPPPLHLSLDPFACNPPEREGSSSRRSPPAGLAGNVLTGHSATVTAVAALGALSHLPASCSVAAPTPLRNLRRPPRLLPAGKGKVMSGSVDGTVRIWRTADGARP